MAKKEGISEAFSAGVAGDYIEERAILSKDE